MVDVALTSRHAYRVADAILILDSDVLTLCEPNGHFNYLRRRAGLHLIAVRLAREQAERGPVMPSTPPPRASDAPVYMLLNDERRTLNDAGVVLMHSRIAELERAVARHYLRPENHRDDITNVACAFAHGEGALSRGEAPHVWWVSADVNCCKKAALAQVALGGQVGVLYARRPGAKAIPQVRELGIEFPP